MQIAALLCCSSSRITARVPKTQSQIGSSDCGVFAIAFATDLAFGLNPASHYYEQDKLRPHFIECLKNQQMTLFPSKNIQPGKPKTEYLYVYCHCRIPQMMVRNGWLSALAARNGTTSHVKTFPKQYLMMIVMTGNVKCALLGRNSLLS